MELLIPYGIQQVVCPGLVEFDYNNITQPANTLLLTSLL